MFKHEDLGKMTKPKLGSCIFKSSVLLLTDMHGLIPDRKKKSINLFTWYSKLQYNPSQPCPLQKTILTEDPYILNYIIFWITGLFMNKFCTNMYIHRTHFIQYYTLNFKNVHRKDTWLFTPQYLHAVIQTCFVHWFTL